MKLLIAALGLCSSPVFAGLYVGPTLTYESVYTDNIRFQAISPRLTLGYGEWQTKWIYLAAEAFGSPKDYDYHNSDVQRQLKVQYSFGGSILPGVFLDDVVMAYVRLGVVYYKFSATNQTLPGAQGGIGVDVTAWNCWNVRGEYDYARFRNLGEAGNPRSEEVSLSLIYHFEPTEV